MKWAYLWGMGWDILCEQALSLCIRAVFDHCHSLHCKNTPGLHPQLKLFPVSL
jgi:hypothetical protein